MRVTIIDGDVSYPPTSGKRIRTLNLMLGLADSFKITYIARSDSASNLEAETFLRDHRINPILVHAPLPRKSGAEFYARLAANLAEAVPYSVATHVHQSLRTAVLRDASTAAPDLFQLEWTGYGYCVDGSDVPVVVQAHNIDALIWQRYRDVERSPIKRAYIATQLRKMQAFERSAFRRASRVVAVSAEDAELARSLYGELPLEVVDNGVDIAYFERTGREPGAGSILFLGALDWRPNLDAVDFLLDEIWPLVRMQRPDATLNIVGRHATAGLRRRIEEVPGAALYADVPDVRPYMRSAAALAVPLRIGGGSRLKILEALAAELPVISSAVGAEGLRLAHGAHITLAERPQAFADALIDAMQRPDHHQRLAASGRAHVEAHNDWRVLSKRLGQIWLSAAKKKAEPMAAASG